MQETIPDRYRVARYTTNRIREAATTAWDQLWIWNKPLTKRSLCGFGFSRPPRLRKQWALASCLNCLQTAYSARSVRKSRNMTGMQRNRSSGWEMLSWVPWGVLISPGWSCCVFKEKRGMALETEMYWKLDVFLTFLLPPRPPGMTSTSRCCRLLWSCTSLQTSTWSKRYGEQQHDSPRPPEKNKEINEGFHHYTRTVCPVRPDLRHHKLHPLPLGLFIGSSCGVSVCQGKPRRSTVWWKRSRRGTASATPEYSSQQVGYKAGYSIISTSFCFTMFNCLTF